MLRIPAADVAWRCWDRLTNWRESVTTKDCRLRERREPCPTKTVTLWLIIGALAACNGGSGPTAPRLRGQACLERAVFGAPEESPYVLPYAVGAAYNLQQSYCNSAGSHHNQLAYDFTMPRGDDIVAARSGAVTRVVDEYADDDTNNDHFNYLIVEHDNGTAAFYAHLQRGGFRVAEGDSVIQGQVIATSGSSGMPPGHAVLHFEVAMTALFSGDYDVGVNFSNAAGPLDERGGLIVGEIYQAMPY